MYRVLFLHDDLADDGSTEVIQYGPGPDFLDYISEFFGMEIRKSKDMLYGSESSFFIPSQEIEVLEVFEREFVIRQMCNDVLVNTIRELKTDNAKRHLVKRVTAIEVV